MKTLTDALEKWIYSKIDFPPKPNLLFHRRVMPSDGIERLNQQYQQVRELAKALAESLCLSEEKIKEAIFPSEIYLFANRYYDIRDDVGNPADHLKRLIKAIAESKEIIIVKGENDEIQKEASSD